MTLFPLRNKDDISAWRKAMYRRHQGTAVEPRTSNEEATSSVEVKVVTRLKRLRNTNQYEITSVPVAIPKPAPPPDLFPKYGADARVIVQEFEDYLKGRMPHDYVERLLCFYFKRNSRRQGQLMLFVDPLDNLYRMQKNYADVVAKALQTDSPSEQQQKLARAGEPIGQLVHWLEDIWHAGIDGPQNLRLAYGKRRLKWQRESISVATTV
ncbi:hypothetical protein ARMGADRAFT_1070548 [Armillaria gallica]|uniref:Uncharacterized protein n=1 Tax=Armillaria gallica TaxID=47427 RepID=A0A2H3EXE0_ARMGA|nr:hypothetical protein ARMGADRAFT_1070548 [Armillaria gallica]